MAEDSRSESGAQFQIGGWDKRVSREDESFRKVEIIEPGQQEGPIPKMFAGRVRTWRRTDSPVAVE